MKTPRNLRPDKEALKDKLLEEISELKAENERFRDALKKIAENYCTPASYSKIAEQALKEK